MKPLLNSFASGILVLLAGGCVGAENTYVEQPVPVAVAEPPSIPPPQPPAQPQPEFQVQPQAAVATAPIATAVQPLDQLVAPIALYPDVLVALLLPASTMSSDVVLAARYLAGGGDPQQVDAQGWDDSVKGLAHYPEVVKWMDENLAWTQQLGAAYLDNPENVMAAVQRVRAEARSKGLLADTPQQQIVADGDAIEIIPAQPDVIYVPRYDPEIIFVDRPVFYDSDPWMTFGLGFGVGWWLSYDFDWHRRQIWIDHRSRERWHDHRHDWRQPHFPGGGGHNRGPDWQPWRPSPGRPRPPHRDFDPGRRPISHPAPLPGTPPRDHGRRDQPPHVQPRPSVDTPRQHPGRPNPPPNVNRPRPDRAPPAARPVPNPTRNPEPGDRRPGRRDEPAATTPRTDRPVPTMQPPRPTPATTPREAPRVAPTPQPAANRVPPAAPAAQPARTPPTMERRVPAQPDQRRAAPAAPRQERTERAQHSAPAPRSQPAANPPAPARDDNRDSRDRRDQER